MTVSTKISFDWSEELNQLIKQSLITSFGLDFLLVTDKIGGDVDTINNVRQKIYATKENELRYKHREQYDSDKYHQHSNYIKTGKKHHIQQKSENGLQDAYTNKILSQKDTRHLDHVISAKEIHDDPGRILADLDGIKLANQKQNLQSTLRTINQSKQEKSVNDYLQSLPAKIADKKKTIENEERTLASIPQETPQEKDKYQKLKDTIRKKKKFVTELESINPEKMRKADKRSRKNYEQQINLTYYTSSKFLKNTGIQATNIGVQMGLRQALGLVLAEIWFEFQNVLPELYNKYKNISFEISLFFNDIKMIFQNIIQRVKKQFQDILTSFKEGMLGGILSSIMNTILNIFLTTTKMWGKIIRETWNNIVKIAKMVFFNPENLSVGELTKRCFKLVSLSLGTILGTIIHSHLTFLSTLPFGSYIQNFVSVLVAGLITLGLNFFLEESSIMQRIWKFLDQFQSYYDLTLEYYKKVNKKLDAYLIELSKIEFNFNISELDQFCTALENINNKLECHFLLNSIIKKEGIKLSYEAGNNKSVKKWLTGLCDD